MLRTIGPRSGAWHPVVLLFPDLLLSPVFSRPLRVDRVIPFAVSSMGDVSWAVCCGSGATTVTGGFVTRLTPWLTGGHYGSGWRMVPIALLLREWAGGDYHNVRRWGPRIARRLIDCRRLDGGRRWALIFSGATLMARFFGMAVSSSSSWRGQHGLADPPPLVVSMGSRQRGSIRSFAA